MPIFVCQPSHLPRPLSTQWRTRRRCNFNNAIARSHNIVYLTRLMAWPAYFPPDCPTSGAVPADGRVWRLVRTSSPDRDDFRSQKEMHPATRRKPEKLECQSCGLSVQRDPSDCIRLKTRVPGYSDYFLASADLTSEHGFTLSTPSKIGGASHETWWVPQRVEPWTFFVVSTEVDDGSR
jgi:hypothetical protein